VESDLRRAIAGDAHCVPRERNPMRYATALSLLLATLGIAACDDTPVPGPDPVTPGPSGTQIVRETLEGTASATASTPCSEAFRLSVDASYFLGGSGRCVEFPRTSATAGIITARLTWQDPRIDLDLVLNDGVRTNYRQSIAANRCCENVEFFVNGGTSYQFVIYVRGVDPQFLANGGAFTGDVTTPFTLAVERPQ